MGVIINNKQTKKLPLPELKKKAGKLMKALGKGKWELSVLFCDDQFIAELNAAYLKRTGPTNVISFPQPEFADLGIEKEQELLLGDVVISVDTAQKEAKMVKQPLEAYLVELLIHGILHLVGFDHETGEKDAKAMEKERLRLWTILEKK